MKTGSNLEMATKFVLIAQLVICANAIVLINNPLYCYSGDIKRPQIEMFGNTTPYGRVRSHFINSDVSKCKPSRFWFLGRHGMRFPSKADHDNLFSATDNINIDIMKNYNSLKTTLCPSDAELIKNWKINPSFTLRTSGALTSSGWTELSNIASRLQKSFPTLLPKQYDPKYYYFRHSPIQRTLDSARAFADGLFGPTKFDSVDYEGSPYPDRYLLPYFTCPIWLSFWQNVSEAQIFMQGQHYQQMIKQVSAKLGFHGSQRLNASTIEKLMTHCKYEQIFNQISPSAFCSAFSIANHQVNDYYKDLQFYYGCGYGNAAYRKLYENMSCNLIQEMLKFLQSNESSDRKAKLWFGHDITLQLMLTTLGLYEDDVPLTGSNFAQETARKWKTSFLSPMTGNIAVVRFE